MLLFLKEEARRHFNCPILEGMELENQGGTGTELNHWEKRLLEVRPPSCSSSSLSSSSSRAAPLQNEAMTGSHTQNRVFSRLTLAIMEDSGWYRANYSLAQRLDWGRGLGCDFVMKSCKFWMDQQHQRSPPPPHCCCAAFAGHVTVCVVTGGVLRPRTATPSAPRRCSSPAATISWPSPSVTCRGSPSRCRPSSRYRTSRSCDEHRLPEVTRLLSARACVRACTGAVL